MPIPGVIAADLVVVQADLVLGGWKHSSTAQRIPAMRTSSASDVRAGPKQT